MVKNKRGGNRNRRGARKNTQGLTKTIIRKAVEEGEIYARVMRVFGNGMADVLCNDGVLRLLIIRRKFRGKHQRDNAVKLAGIVLVGIRLWEVVAPGKKSKVDLLCVYSNAHIQELKKLDDFNNILLSTELSAAGEKIAEVEMQKGTDWNETDKLRAVDENGSSNIVIDTDTFGDMSFDDI